jgi:hypothetical protein
VLLVASFAACSEDSSSTADDDGGSRGGTGGSSSGDSSGKSSGGTAGLAGSDGAEQPGATAGDTGNAGQSSAGEPTCAGDMSELTIDGSNWIPGACNDAAIQGAWYCYTDGISESDCDGKPRYADGGYCISGKTTSDPSGAAWGAALAFELNHPDGGAKTSYDATEHGLTGFAFEVVGSTGGAPLRIAFNAKGASGVQPFVEFSALDAERRTLRASIADAAVPADWNVLNAGATVDAAHISDIELRVAGGTSDDAYDLCVVSVTPLFD